MSVKPNRKIKLNQIIYFGCVILPLFTTLFCKGKKIMRKWVFIPEKEEKTKTMPENEKEAKSFWDRSLDHHRWKKDEEEEEAAPKTKKRSPKKIKVTNHQKEEVENDETPQSIARNDDDQPKRGKYKVTERTYYTDEKPGAEKRGEEERRAVVLPKPKEDGRGEGERRGVEGADNAPDDDATANDDSTPAE